MILGDLQRLDNAVPAIQEEGVDRHIIGDLGACLDEGIDQIAGQRHVVKLIPRALELVRELGNELAVRPEHIEHGLLNAGQVEVLDEVDPEEIEVAQLLDQRGRIAAGSWNPLVRFRPSRW